MGRKQEMRCQRVCTLSCVQLFAIPGTVAPWDPLSMGFPRQECWNRFPFPSPENLPDLRIEPISLESLALAGRFFTTVPLKPLEGSI